MTKGLHLVMLYISQPDSKEAIVNNVLAIVFIHELSACRRSIRHLCIHR